MISRKKAPKKEEEPVSSALNTSKRQPSETDKPPLAAHSPLTPHSSIKSNDSAHSDSRDPEKDSKRTLIYDTESFKEEPESLPPSTPSSNDIFAKIFLAKSPYSETMSTASSHSHKAEKEERGMGIADFVLGKKLGSGKFGEVFVARHRRSGFICALKRIGKGSMDPKLLVQLVREIKIQSFLNHPNVVKLYTFFADEAHVYLVQELCYSGQLYSLLKRKRKLGEELTRVIVQQICRALDYMH